ncbi:MAG: PD-(D/E)XK nuclease family protein [Lachnospiraceae bacterium]|nr:PD-(D/E)XK nuclease family protein [Lachnospiraceae bacterium]
MNIRKENFENWINHNCRETHLLITNSIRNGNRLLRRENKKYCGAIIANVSQCHLLELAKTFVEEERALEGQWTALDIISDESAIVLLEQVLWQESCENYFVSKESICLQTATEVFRCIRQIQMGQVTDAYKNSQNRKVQQLDKLIDIYEEKLVTENLYDSVRIFQEAIQYLQEDSIDRKKVEYGIFDNYYEKLTALEREFLEIATKETYTILSFWKENVEISEQLTSVLKGSHFFKGYGIANEVQYIVEKIFEEKQRFGAVSVLYTSAEYEPFLEAAFSSVGIPYCMTERQLSSDNCYLEFMKMLLRWAEDDYSYQALKQVIFLEGLGIEIGEKEKSWHTYTKIYYETLREELGWGLNVYKIYIQKKTQEIKLKKEEIEQVKEELKKIKYIEVALEKQKLNNTYHELLLKEAFLEFLRNIIEIFDIEKGKEISYSDIYWKLVSVTHKSIGNRKEWKKTKSVLEEAGEVFQYMGTSKNMDQVVQVLLEQISKLTCQDSEITDAILMERLGHKVHVLERKYIYLIGLSSVYIANKLIDSSVLSDAELELYLDKGAGCVSLHCEKEHEVRKHIYQTLLTKKDTQQLYFGYCSYDTIHLRKMSPSVCYLRFLQMAGVLQEDIVLSEYSHIITSDVSFREDNIWHISRPIIMSATKLQTLLNCPLHYYYQYVLHLPNEEFKKSEAKYFVQPVEIGRLIHGILDTYAKEWFWKESAKQIPTKLQEYSFQEIVEEQKQQVFQYSTYQLTEAYQVACTEAIIKCKTYLQQLHEEYTNPDNKWEFYWSEVNFDKVFLSYQAEGCCETGTENSIEICLEGTIDRIDCYKDAKGITHYRIIDYKTGKRKYHEKSIENGYQIQHILYALAVEKSQKEIGELPLIDEVSFVYFSEEDEKQQVVTYTTEQVRDFQDKVRKVFVEVLLNEHYCKLEDCDCNKNSKSKDMLTKTDCTYCTYKDICKEYMGEEV